MSDKKTNVYFVRTDPDYDEVLFFHNYSNLRDFIQEMAYEGEEVERYMIYSAKEDSYKKPTAKMEVDVPE